MESISKCCLLVGGWSGMLWSSHRNSWKIGKSHLCHRHCKSNPCLSVTSGHFESPLQAEIWTHRLHIHLPISLIFPPWYDFLLDKHSSRRHLYSKHDYLSIKDGLACAFRCYHRPTLDSFARHHETGEALPEDLYQKLVAAKNFRFA